MKNDVTYYKGTAEQALALANDIMRRHNDDKVTADSIDTIEDAVEAFTDEVEHLADLCKNASKSELLNAIFHFSRVESAFNVLQIKVNEAYEFDEDESEDE